MPDPLLTITEIARECGVRVHQARYAIREYDIQERQRAGVIRLWSRDDLPRIRSALKRIGQRAGGLCHA